MTEHDVPKPCLSRSWTDRLRCCLPQGHTGDHTNQLATDVRQIMWTDNPEPAVLSARQTASTITDTQLDALYARIADYENRITWHTTCASCARTLDSSIRETERREHAEAALDQAREAAAWIRRNYPALTHANDRLTAALAEPAAGPAATQATDTAKEI